VIPPSVPALPLKLMTSPELLPEMKKSTPPVLKPGLDYDLWIRLAKHHTLLKVDDCLATFRMHGGSKTPCQRAAVFKASIDLLKAHYRLCAVRTHLRLLLRAARSPRWLERVARAGQLPPQRQV
jgi:hypothetical protein